MAEHVKLLGIISIAYSALVLLGGIIVFLVANTLFSLGASDLHGAAVPGFLHPLLGLVGIALLARGALGVVAGWGLLEYAPWARLLSLILGFISLLSVPFGTALGIYTIWVLLASNAEKQYQALA